jgi:hypothetical protein
MYFIQNEADQRGFTRAIASNKANLVSGRDNNSSLIEQHPSGDAECEVIDM